MGNIDAFPVLSQGKSTVQLALGDKKGAKETQERFLRTAPIVSQVNSAIQLAQGDKQEAKEIQKEFITSLEPVVNRIPVLGHIKGTYHLSTGDLEKAENCFKQSTRTIFVLAAGAGGFLIAGLPGAFAGGVLGGQAIDGILTGVESSIKNKFCPNGTVINAVLAMIDKDQRNKPPMFVTIYDMIITMVADAVIGHCGSHFFQKVSASKSVATSATTNAVQQSTSQNFVVTNGMVSTLKTSLQPHMGLFKQLQIKGMELKTILKAFKQELNSLIQVELQSYNTVFMAVYMSIMEDQSYFQPEDFSAIIEIPLVLKKFKEKAIEFFLQQSQSNTITNKNQEEQKYYFKEDLLQEVQSFKERSKRDVIAELEQINQIFLDFIQQDIDESSFYSQPDQANEYIASNPYMLIEVEQLFRIINDLANMIDIICDTLIDGIQLGGNIQDMLELMSSINVHYEFHSPKVLMIKIGEKKPIGNQFCHIKTKKSYKKVRSRRDTRRMKSI